MENIDLYKLKVAIEYTDRIANGRNPVTNKPASEEDVLNNPNVIRCMFFIRDVLRKVSENGGKIGQRQTSLRKEVPLEQLMAYQYQGDTTISRIVQKMNTGIDRNIYRTFTVQMVTKWLEARGYVDTHPEGSERQKTRPTEKGKEIGLYTEERNAGGNSYEVVMYGEQAQNLIAGHAEEILLLGKHRN